MLNEKIKTDGSVMFVRGVTDFLDSQESPDQVNMEGTSLSLEGIKYLGEWFGTSLCPSVDNIDLYNINITSEGFKYILEGFKKAKESGNLISLNILNLDDNQLKLQDVQKLMDVLYEEGGAFKELLITNNLVDAAEAETLSIDYPSVKFTEYTDWEFFPNPTLSTEQKEDQAELIGDDCQDTV